MDSHWTAKAEYIGQLCLGSSGLHESNLYISKNIQYALKKRPNENHNEGKW